MWVDQNLILSMYPDVNLFLQVFDNPGEHDFKRMLLNMITTSLYLGLPLLWCIMMAWAGIRAGQSLNHAMQPLSAPVHDAGQQGGAFGKANGRPGREKMKGFSDRALTPGLCQLRCTS